MIRIPVLLVVFNRPNTTKKVFECIIKARPEKLYIAVDGPRESVIGEKELCEEVICITKKINYPCKTFYRINERNLGPEITVSSAISWVLEKEEFVIVLEDDIIAPLSFFVFMQEMLIKYRNETQVAMVSGMNPTPANLPNNEDYLFGLYGHTWGWGTWARAWNEFDLFVNDFDKYWKPSFLKKYFRNPEEIIYHLKLFKKLKKKGAGRNTWDYCWYFIRFKKEWLTIIPKVNLTSNIGVFGFHADGPTKYHNRSVDENFIVRKHPTLIQRNVQYDTYHFFNYLKDNTSLHQKLFNKLVRLLKG